MGFGRLSAAILFFFAMFTAPALAHGTGGNGFDMPLSDRMCVGVGDDLRCGIRAIPSTLRVHRLSIDLAGAPQPVGERLVLLSRVFRFQSLALDVRYADGSHRRIAVPQSAIATAWIAGARFKIELGKSPAAIEQIDVEIRNAHEAKLFTEVRLQDGEALARVHHRYIMLFGIFIGIVIAPLAYNAALYPALRNRFQITYCVMAVTTIVYGLMWSNLVYVVWPEFPHIVRYFSTHALLSLIVFLNVLFLVQFVEPRAIGPRMRQLLLATALLPVASAVWIILASAQVPSWFNAAQHASFGVVTALVCIASITAISRGSTFIWYYLAGWAAGYAAGLFRLLRAFDLIEQRYYVDVTIFWAIAAQALIIALGIAHRAVTLRRERDAAKRRQSELQTLADSDALTGLLNRRAFSDRIAALVSSDDERALVLIDLDNFKAVNDRHGHVTGDAALSAVADVIRAAMPQDALCARLGGEEFAVYIAGPRAKREAKACAVNLHRMIQRGSVALADGQKMPLTISVGVAADAADPLGGWQALYVAADEALYRAKRRGRDCIEYDWERTKMPSAATG